MNIEKKKRVAVVTGASSGIGEASNCLLSSSLTYNTYVSSNIFRESSVTGTIVCEISEGVD